MNWADLALSEGRLYCAREDTWCVYTDFSDGSCGRGSCVHMKGWRTMARVTLEQMWLHNFKGVADLQINFGKVTNVYGANATGKTTIFDAFLWLLFGKDSSDRADFQVKTIDQGGSVIHGLEHDVRADLLVDGKKVTFQKVYREKWTKRRGEATRTMTGHETEFFVNGVPMKKSDYEIEVRKIVPEELFRLITNPLHFGSVLPWKDRRAMLLEVVGDVSDYDVMEHDPALSQLGEILDGHTIPDFRAMVAAQKRKINDELGVIPARIDEVSRQIPETELDYSAMEAKAAEVKNQIASLDEAMTDAGKIFDTYRMAADAILTKRTELRTLEAELSARAAAPLKELRRELTDAETELADMEHKIRNLEAGIRQSEWIRQLAQEDIVALRDSWNEENEKAFAFSEPDTCPTCGQSLPVEQIEGKRREMEERWRSEKQRKLQEITTAGKAKSEALEREKEHLEKLKAEHHELSEKAKALPSRVKELQEQVDGFTAPNAANDPAYKKLSEEIEAGERNLQKPSSAQLDSLREQKKEAQELLDRIHRELAQRDTVAAAKKRVEELAARERELANMLAKLEGQEKLTEDFIRTKVDMLEARINEKFQVVRFKMFSELINGGLEECCEVLIDGVPYQDANNAAKINGGIDIINTLAEHYDVSAPIFVDNRESVVDLIQTDSQVVNLIVSAGDLSLRVEVA